MQLFYPMPATFMPPSSTREIRFDYFPYFDARYLAVAASLNGGNVLASMVRGIQKVVSEIADVTVSEEKIWERLMQLAGEQERDGKKEHTG